jgi:hypothetical protein
MNEEIRKLFIRSTGHDSTINGRILISPRNIEDFATAIIKQCMTISEKATCGTYEPGTDERRAWNEATIEVTKEFKKHFGIDT